MRDEDGIRNPEVRSQKGHEPILAELPWPGESAKNTQITKRTPLLTCGFTRGYRGGHQKPAGVDTVPELMMAHPCRGIRMRPVIDDIRSGVRCPAGCDLGTTWSRLVGLGFETTEFVC